jgi:hypothetical protein
MNKRFNTRFYATRLMLKHVFLKPKARQLTITKFVQKFRTQKKNFFKTTQAFIFMILLSSQMFLFKKDCLFFIKKYGVFINGAITFNMYSTVVAGDVVQLPIVSTYYTFFKFYSFFYTNFYRKYRLKFNKIARSKRKKYRIRSKKMPN